MESARGDFMGLFEISLFILLIALVLLCVDIRVNLHTIKQKLMHLGVQYQRLGTEIKNIDSGQRGMKFELDLLEKNEEKAFMENPIMDCGEKLKIKSLFKGKRVLIGDYNIEMLKHTKKIFMSLGFDVDVVSSGEEIVDKIKSGYFCDVIVTNHIYKDGCDGQEVLRVVKSIEPTLPIVALTVSVGKRNKFIHSYGFDGYLEKSLTQKQAEEEMKKLLLSNKEKHNL